MVGILTTIFFCNWYVIQPAASCMFYLKINLFNIWFYLCLNIIDMKNSWLESQRKPSFTSFVYKTSLLESESCLNFHAVNHFWNQLRWIPLTSSTTCQVPANQPTMKLFVGTKKALRMEKFLRTDLKVKQLHSSIFLKTPQSRNQEGNSKLRDNARKYVKESD